MRYLHFPAPLSGEAEPTYGYLHSQGGLDKVNIERRWIADANEEWRKRYAVRAGVERMNSELKRRHGLGHLRVRGGRRVRLAVYLNALACNIKRMIHALQMQKRQAQIARQTLVADPA